jgi:OOP family OmpA-OmpF porin
MSPAKGDIVKVNVVRTTVSIRLMAALLIGLVVVACGKAPAPPPAEVSTPPAAIERVPLPDADVDGVPDATDACPGSPVGITVDERGCVPDADGDGVGDTRDACPDSPLGTTVDESGCRPRLDTARAFTLPVEFASGSAQILGEVAPALSEVVSLLEQYPETTVSVEGHTDSRGDTATNLDLSRARAEAVAAALIAAGVTPERIVAVGYGETRPIQPNDTPQSRAANRRVVAIVVPGS